MSNIPKGLQTYFLNETESEERPIIRREGANIIIPILIREETKTDESGDRTIFKFFNVETAYTGQDIENYEKCCIQSYAAIRSFLYGSPAVQSEMRDDDIWEAHRLAVRAAFPKYRGEVQPRQDRFMQIVREFWAAVRVAAASVGKTRADLPDYFNDSDMLTWAAANNVPADVIATTEEIMFRVASNLNANHRNWSELFIYEE